MQSKKIAALGNLVAGIAHEINTPIGVGVTAITFLHNKLTNFIEEIKGENIKFDFRYK